MANFGDVFDAVAKCVDPVRPAIICDGHETSWKDFDARSNRLAHALLASSLSEKAKIGLMMRNGPDYLIVLAACFKARLVPVNINFRYREGEVDYLLANADTEAIFYGSEFEPVVTRTTTPLKLRCNTSKITSEASSLSPLDRFPATPVEQVRDPDDIFLLYTGGTTGMPKGVMWPCSSLWGVLSATRAAQAGMPSLDGIDALQDAIREGRLGPIWYIAPPLMHGTGMFAALHVLSCGGTVVCSASTRFDPKQTLEELHRLRCSGLVIVGDAFAQPLVSALEAEPGAFDLTALQTVISSGMIWRDDVKRRMLDFIPNAELSDTVGASEGTNMARSAMTRETRHSETRFQPSNGIVVSADTHRPIAAGSDEIGIIATAGPLPLGYYKDPERTARTYVEIDGVRRFLTGDHAMVNPDGTIRFLGRGSECINSAGEKIYPEEVETVLKTHPGVQDAIVFGVSDERLGQRAVALVSTHTAVGPDELAAHVRTSLAGYKLPKSIVFTPQVPRLPNGKSDLPAARALFAAKSGST